MDSESHISSRSQTFIKFDLDFAFSEGEALRVLADLHGGGDKSNEAVVLEYEEIKQQVTIGTNSKIFNCKIKQKSARRGCGQVEGFYSKKDTCSSDDAS